MGVQLSALLRLPRNVNFPCAPRNITRARCALLQIAAFFHLRGCCEMLMQFGFWPRMYYLCTSEEEKAHRDGVFSSFFAKILTYKGWNTSEIGKNTSEIIFFLGFTEIFFGEVVISGADIERRSVKIYLFFWDAFFHFMGMQLPAKAPQWLNNQQWNVNQ